MDMLYYYNQDLFLILKYISPDMSTRCEQNTKLKKKLSSAQKLQA